jgi:Fe-S cluster assembly ATPase SufC
VKSGDAELAKEVEKTGYAWLEGAEEQGKWANSG